MDIKLKGIDVSVWNGNIDWKKVSEQIDFAILRAGYGREVSQKDQKFEANYSGCKANNIPVGVYWYNYAKTPADAKTEAKACIEILKGKSLEYPVWYDIEEGNVLATGKNNVSKIVETFCEELKNAGYKVGIYSSLSGLSTAFSDDVKKKYDVWVAHVGSGGTPINYTPYQNKQMWQYSWKGQITGISGDVDEDWCYVEYKQEEKPVEEKKPEAKPVEEKKPETKPAVKKPEPKASDIDVYYGAFVRKGYCKWLSTIKNCNDTNDMGYAGVEGFPITGFTAMATKGTLRYRAHVTNVGWFAWVDKSNRNDWRYGIAGNPDTPIDGIQLELVNAPGYQVMYRVSLMGSNEYLPWVTGLEDYAGIYGKIIDKIQIKIVKV